jgi:hypothetical protein
MYSIILLTYYRFLMPFAQPTLPLHFPAFEATSGWRISSEYDPLPAPVRAAAKKFFDPYNALLFEMLGIKPFAEWKDSYLLTRGSTSKGAAIGVQDGGASNNYNASVHSKGRSSKGAKSQSTSSGTTTSGHHRQLLMGPAVDASLNGYFHEGNLVGIPNADSNAGTDAEMFAGFQFLKQGGSKAEKYLTDITEAITFPEGRRRRG